MADRIEGLERAVEALEAAPQTGKGLFFYRESGAACAVGTLARAAGLDPAAYDWQPGGQVVFETVRRAYGLTNGEIARVMALNDHGHQGQVLPNEAGRRDEALDYLRGLLEQARREAGSPPD